MTKPQTHIEIELAAFYDTQFSSQFRDVIGKVITKLDHSPAIMQPVGDHQYGKLPLNLFTQDVDLYFEHVSQQPLPVTKRSRYLFTFVGVEDDQPVSVTLNALINWDQQVTIKLSPTTPAGLPEKLTGRDGTAEQRKDLLAEIKADPYRNLHKHFLHAVSTAVTKNDDLYFESQNVSGRVEAVVADLRRRDVRLTRSSMSQHTIEKYVLALIDHWIMVADHYIDLFESDGQTQLLQLQVNPNLQVRLQKQVHYADRTVAYTLRLQDQEREKSSLTATTTKSLDELEYVEGIETVRHAALKLKLTDHQDFGVQNRTFLMYLVLHEQEIRQQFTNALGWAVFSKMYRQSDD